MIVERKSKDIDRNIVYFAKTSRLALRSAGLFFIMLSGSQPVITNTTLSWCQALYKNKTQTNNTLLFG